MSDGVFEVLEVESKETGATDLISKLDAIEKHLEKVVENTNKANGAHKEHERHARGLVGAFQNLIHQGLEPFLHKAKEIAEFEFIRRIADKVIEAPAELAEALVELGEEMINTAAKAERTNTSFELLFGGKEPGHEVLEYIEDIAKATEFTGERMKGAAMELAKVGFSGEGLKRALAASIDIAALSPNKEEGMSAALTALERVKASGRVDARTLLRFGVGPEEFFKELSARTGEGVETLKKKVEKGKIDSSEALEALYKVIAKKTGEETLGEAGLKVGEGLEAKLTHLKELPERFFEKLAETDSIKKLTVQIDKMLEKLDPDGPEGRRIYGALKSVFDGIVDTLEHFDIASLIEGVVDAVETATLMLLELMALIPGETGNKAGFVLNNMKQRRQERAVDEADRKTIEARGSTPEFETEADYADLETAEKSGALGAKSKAYADGQATAEGHAEGMEAGKPLVKEKGHEIGKAASSGTKEELGIHSPSRVFAEMGEQTAAGFARGVDSGADMVDDVMQDAFAVPAPQGGRVPAIGGSPMMVSFGDINVTVPPGSNATETAQILRAAVRDEITDLLERYRAQQGG